MNKKNAKSKVALLSTIMLIILSTVFGFSGCSGSIARDKSNETNITENTQEQDFQNNTSEIDPDAQYSLDTMVYIPEFTSEDQHGNIIDNSIFSKAEYTLIVLWGTWCGPCVAEIPILVEAEKELNKMGVQIVGVCEDGKTELEQVNDILELYDATYLNIIPSAEFYDDFVSLCFSFPTSMIVDSNGSVVKNAFGLEREPAPLINQVKEIIGDVSTNVTGNDNTATEKIEEEPIDPIEEFYNTVKKDMMNYYSIDSIEMKNLDVIQGLHKKAYEYCTPTYYYEIVFERPDGPRTVKHYVQNGSYRSEEYVGDKISWITVYNKNEDTHYLYDVEKNDLEQITNASKKGHTSIMNYMGSFEFIGNNALVGEIGEEDYNGKPAIVSIYGDSDEEFLNKVWYDKETGVILRWLQVQGEDEYTSTYSVTPGEAFDKV